MQFRGRWVTEIIAATQIDSETYRQARTTELLKEHFKEVVSLLKTGGERRAEALVAAVLFSNNKSLATQLLRTPVGPMHPARFVNYRSQLSRLARCERLAPPQIPGTKVGQCH